MKNRKNNNSNKRKKVEIPVKESIKKKHTTRRKYTKWGGHWRKSRGDTLYQVENGTSAKIIDQGMDMPNIPETRSWREGTSGRKDNEN